MGRYSAEADQVWAVYMLADGGQFFASFVDSDQAKLAASNFLAAGIGLIIWGLV